MGKPRRKLGIRYVAGAAAVAVALSLPFLRKPTPEPLNETIQECPSNECPPPPQKSDNRCQLAYGEADPFSENFDPESCGYCGDGVRQVNAEVGAPRFIDLDSFLVMQNVTERPSETPETCPVDFHCGNGQFDAQRPYGAVVEEDGKYIVGTIHINESCRSNSERYCESDCRLRRRDRLAHEEPEEEPARRWEYSTLTCPSRITSDSARDMTSARSLAGGSVVGRIASTVRTHSSNLRTALAIDPADELEIITTMVISPRGSVSLRGIAATCNNQPCGSHRVVLDAIQLDLTGLTVAGPGRECWWTVTMTVP